MYLKNSQARRDLPTPATPGDEHQARRVALGRGVEELLDEAKLVVPSDEGGLEDPRALRAGDGGDDPGRLEEPDGLGLALELVLAGVDVGDRGRGGGPGRLVDIAAPRRGGRLDAGGGVDPVADDEALLGGLGRGRAAGHDPDPGLEVGLVLGAVGGDGRDELEAGPHRPLGVVLLRDRGAPDRHDGVADELLDDAAVAADDGPGELEVAREELAHLLGVAFLRERREADEVAEQHRDVAELGGRRSDLLRPAEPCLSGGGRDEPLQRSAAPTGVPQSPQNRLPGSSCAPHAEQTAASDAPQSSQNRLPSGFSPPHAGQRIRPSSACRKATTPRVDVHLPGHER